MGDRVQRIISLEREAESAERIAGDVRYRAAELIAAELADGKSQRQLASEIEKSQAHVSKCAAIWVKYGSDSPENRPAWSEAYRGVSSKRTPKPKPESTGDIPPDGDTGTTGPGGSTAVAVKDSAPKVGDGLDSFANLRSATGRQLRAYFRASFPDAESAEDFILQLVAAYREAFDI